MPTLRLRFVATHGLTARAIRSAQLGFPYVHVDAEELGGYLGAHLEGGVAVRPIGYDAGPGVLERWVELDVDGAQTSAFHAFLGAQVGKPYDLSAIEDFAWAGVCGERWPTAPGAWRQPDRWDCAELIAAALVHAGILPGALADEARHVTPQCLMFAVAAIGRLGAPKKVNALASV